MKKKKKAWRQPEKAKTVNQSTKARAVCSVFVAEHHDRAVTELQEEPVSYMNFYTLI